MTWEEYKTLLPIEGLRMLAEDFPPRWDPNKCPTRGLGSPIYSAMKREYPTAQCYENGIGYIRLHPDGPNTSMDTSLESVKKIFKALSSESEGYLYSKVYS